MKERKEMRNTLKIFPPHEVMERKSGRGKGDKKKKLKQVKQLKMERKYEINCS